MAEVSLDGKMCGEPDRLGVLSDLTVRESSALRHNYLTHGPNLSKMALVLKRSKGVMSVCITRISVQRINSLKPANLSRN